MFMNPCFIFLQANSINVPNKYFNCIDNIIEKALGEDEKIILRSDSIVAFGSKCKINKNKDFALIQHNLKGGFM